MWGGDGVMLYAPTNPISNLLLFSTAQDYPQKNSSYLSVKERKGDQSDIYLPL